MSPCFTIAAVDTAILLFGARNTQSLPVVMNHRVYLFALQPRMLGYVWQKPQSETSVLIAKAANPQPHILRLSLVPNAPSKATL